MKTKCPLDYDGTVERPGHSWDFYTQPINDERGLTSKLDKEIWLDWHDILAEPEISRMHIYLSAYGDVGASVKRLRMQTWQAAIEVFDSMMVDVQAPLAVEEVGEMLQAQHLPRPTVVQLPTNNPALVRMLEALGIRENPNGEHEVEWNRFVHLAENDALLRPMKYLQDQRR